MDGKIYIIGYIGDSEGEAPEEVHLADVIQQVRRQTKATSFTCYIDSPGGEVEVGESMYTYLRSLKVPIKTIGSNMVASIATVIFMAGDTRTVNEGCEFMIHLPMGGILNATADEMEVHSKSVRNTENRMISFYVKATGLTKEAIAPLLKKESWLTPQQLKSFGFITGDTPLKITASAKINIKPKKQKMSKKNKKNLFERMAAALDKFDKIGTKMIVLKSGDQTDVDFYELEEGTEVTIGAKARIDGKDAEGDITMADGRVITFVAGEVTAINEADPEGDEGDEEMAAKLAAALKENETLKEANAGLTTEVSTLKTEAKAKDKVVANIRKIQSKMAGGDPGRKGAGGAGKKKTKKKGSGASTALANMRALSNKKKEN